MKRRRPVRGIPTAADQWLLGRLTGNRSRPLDRALTLLSRSANGSRLWLATAALLGVVGGRRGRRAAIQGTVSIGITSALVNGPLKLLAAAGIRRR
ncbi:MAG: hypothetical protein ABR564_09750 [Candidatus Dormibacteria bacterium]